MNEYTEGTTNVAEDILLHYGTPRHSGRYPWGSGERAQRSYDFISQVDEYKSKGMSEKDIADKMGITTTQLRSEKAVAYQLRKEGLIKSAKSMAEDGKSVKEISERLGVAQNSVRTYLNTDLQSDKVKAKQIDNISKSLEEAVAKSGYIDVGEGSNLALGISEDKLKKTLKQLEEKGYYVHEVQVKQLNSDNWTIVKTLSKEPDIKEVARNKDKITTLDARTDDGGLTMKKFYEPIPLDRSRVEINYTDPKTGKGGAERDGVILIRPGAEGLDMGNSKYAQVRIRIGDDLYAKGMAVVDPDYKFPKGKDIVFNTNKDKSYSDREVFKEVKSKTKDPNEMFGSSVTDQRGKLNIVNKQGDWDAWDGSKFSSQFLSKQPVGLVKERLDATYEKARKDLDEIMSIPNPVVRKKLLESTISDLESKQVHLKAQGLPHTKAHVLIPFPDMKPDQVYAPNYNDGDRVVLVRYPHAGTFELAELTVNNKSAKARRTLGSDITDAIGIHPSVAQKLSGADFDGDAVYVIPNNQRKVKTSPALKQLKNFDPNAYEVAVDPATGKRPITIKKRTQQQQMGEVSNLITDMTIRGADADEIARAVKHSMVVIDAYKHHLDYKQSEADNNIKALKRKYQGRVNPETGRYSDGASTIVSKSKQDFLAVTDTVRKDGKVITKVTKQKPPTETYIDANGNKKTATLKYKDSYVDADGRRHVLKTEKVKKMLTTDDASTLSSGTKVEDQYVNYANRLKSMRNEAEKSYRATKAPKANPIAAKKYKQEVDSLNEKYKVALANKPRERQAQLKAEQMFRARKQAAEANGSELSKEDIKKLKNTVLAQARQATGAKGKDVRVVLTEKEWEAIDNEAVSPTFLNKVLKYADMDRVRELATPRESSMTPAKVSRARTLLKNGYTPAQVAQSLGVSVSALRYGLYE